MADDSGDPPDDRGWDVAGWAEFHGEWHDVEAGDRDLDFSVTDPVDVDQITIHYINDAGDEIYFTLNGPFDDWDDVQSQIDDALDRYGVE